MMWDDRAPDAVSKIEVDGYRVVAYGFGQGEEVLLCLNGGPGLPCDYLRDSHSWLADRGFRVVAYDQLGCGASDRPNDRSLWTVERYRREVETVRRALGLGRVHLLGQSWGTILGIEYAIAYPEAIKTLILDNGFADVPHFVGELNRLRAALGPETIAMMARHEAEGTLDHPEYQAAVTILNYRHVCRLDDWPAPVKRSLGDWNTEVYGTMQGPNEFTFTGNLTTWSRQADLHRIAAPTLITCGLHDETTPACAMRMHHALPNSRIKVFKNSAHMPFFEEPEAYFATLLGFLARHRG